MGFWSGLFGGSNPTLNQNIGQFGQEAGFATGVGQTDVTAASKWYNDILSGDPTKQAQAIAPETAAAQTQGNQDKKTGAEFGNRGGGTAAASENIDTGTRGDLIKLLGSLTSGAASGAANLGTSEQTLGLDAQQLQDEASQQRMQNWKDSILGTDITAANDTGMALATGGISLLSNSKSQNSGGGGGGGIQPPDESGGWNDMY